MIANRALARLGGTLLVVVLGVSLAGAGTWFFVRRDLNHRPPRLAVAAGVVGVWTGRSYAYVLRAGPDAVLVDAGDDPDAAALRAELATQGVPPERVLAVLLTHGHPDHTAGLAHFRGAAVYMGAEDHRLARGDVLPRAPISRLLSRLAHRPRGGPPMQPVLSGTRLKFTGREVQVVALPGHTAGSVGYSSDGVLFAGDATWLTRHGLRPWPWGFSESPRHAKAILPRLLGVPFVGIADGHTGFAPDGRARLERWLAAHPEVGKGWTATTAGKG
jgi:glyoxylase-like metal-dependent hydrolase (beta-lactamase superfamily II)